MVDRLKHADPAMPSPFPEGWYLVASRRALARTGLIAKRWMGIEIVVWADDQGRICVAESYCPHLGAYLGPDGGGAVCGGRLVCPFHGFEFDTSGQCVATPYAAAPRSARLRIFETRELAGMIFAWWSIEGRAPQWGLPDREPEQDDWSPLEVRTLRFPGHPQETTENSVDLAHLRYVHGYDSVEPDEVTVDGHRLLSRFRFRRECKIGPLTFMNVNIEATAHVYGLGYSFVEVHLREFGLDSRLWVLATPVDGEQIDLSMVSQVPEISSPKRRAAILKLLPLRWRARLLNKFFVLLQQHDVQQDLTIWRRKRYRPFPRLCRSDGEITTYRKYCAQFYPAVESSNQPVTTGQSDNLHLVAD